MTSLNRRLIAGILLTYLRNRRKKLQPMQKITLVLLQFEQRRNNLMRHCLLETLQLMDHHLTRIKNQTSRNG